MAPPRRYAALLMGLCARGAGSLFSINDNNDNIVLIVVKSVIYQYNPNNPNSDLLWARISVSLIICR